ncbi:MAG TPA: KpsF/GutQ family sugar-phosphate isomerase [Alphaproteobacteria bacterium]|jgi:arabinose-5-phosphate isomerase|nr:KpsF/GutQ family sugar-phosphate isomerase [Alphaproteobacteria bacterium]
MAGILESARRVLALEGEGLRALADALDRSFAAAVDLLSGASGRIIVSGMGKSGHVGRKLAATLASTGTPSHYVHPGEASHGDLGMVQAGDAVVALSNSGDTEELRDLVAFARFRGIPLLAIVGRRASPLAEAADVALVLPQVPEACPMGLAPTTSTTMMLALGDALAVALMERRGFSPDQFRVLHPGGRLGRQFIKVEDLMHRGDEMPLVAPDTPMSETLLTMTEKRFGCAGVVDGEGRLVGIVTDGDLRRHMGDGLLTRRTGEIMTAGPKTIRGAALAAEALGQMNASAITSLFVVDDGRPRGIVHVHDILRAGIA